MDAQAALEQPPGPALPGLAEALVLLELALEAVDEPRVAAADAARLLDLERLLAGLGGLGGRDHGQLGHPLQHRVAQLLGPLGVLAGLGAHRLPDDPGQHGRLGQADLRGVPAEVALAGRLDPVVPGAEVDPVQVPVQDLVLGQLPLELGGEGGLLDLADDRDVLEVGVAVADQLLGDGAAALADLAAEQVGDGGAHDPPVVDPLVLVEAGVLGGDHGLLDGRRDLGKRHHDPVLLVLEDLDHAALAVVDLGPLGLAELAQLLQLGEAGPGPLDRVGDQHPRRDRGRGGDQQGQGEGDHHRAGERQPAAPAPVGRGGHGGDQRGEPHPDGPEGSGDPAQPAGQAGDHGIAGGVPAVPGGPLAGDRLRLPDPVDQAGRQPPGLDRVDRVEHQPALPPRPVRVAVAGATRILRATVGGAVRPGRVGVVGAVELQGARHRGPWVAVGHGQVEVRGRGGVEPGGGGPVAGAARAAALGQGVDP